MHTHYTESRKMLLFSAPKPFGGSQKICNQCGGKRTAGVEILGKKIPPASACQREKQFPAAHDVLHFSKRLQLPHNETDVQPSNHQLPGNSRSREKETSPQQGSHLYETPKHGKIRHPACPVHSIKGQFFTHGLSVASTDSQTIHTNSITVTEATIDTKKVDTVDTLTNIPFDTKIPQKGLLPSTPLMATATKSNHPHRQTHSKFHHNALQKVCVSVHATQENTPSHLYTTSKGNATGTIPKTVQAFNTTLMSTKRTTAFPQREIILQNSPHSPRQIKTKEDSQVSPPIGLSDPQKSETQATPINPSHTSVAQAKLNSYSSMVLTCPVKPNVNSKEATIACGTHDPKSLDANKQPVSSNSELTHCGKATFLNESCATLDSTLGMSAPVSITTNYALYRNTALRSFSNIHPSSTLKVNQTNSRVSHNSSLKTSNMSHEHNQSINHNTFPRPDEPCQTQTTDITSEPTSAPAVPNQKNISKTAQALLGASKVSKRDHVSIVSQTVPNRTDISSKLNSELHPDEKLSSGDLINDLLGNGSKQHSGCVSRDATPQSSICPIKSNSLRLRGCIKAKQQTGEHYQGSTVIEHKGQCVTCPTGTTAQQMDSNTEEFASGVSPMHANSRTDSNADKQKHPNYPTASKGKREPIISTLPNRNAHSDLKHTRSLESNKSTFQQSLKGPNLSLIAPALRCSEGELCTHCNSASLRRLGSSEAEAIVSRDSKRAPKRDTADLVLAHSHPSEAAQFLLSSPQCGKSATMQHRLESVEASLAANKDRITTLLNIIHDLEASHTPAPGQQYNKTGQDLKNCSTCQKTACIVYSVEYDFRQQERCFLEVLNLHLTRRNTANRVYRSRALNFSLLRKAVKNVKKSKKKSEKLYKVLLKWLPRKMEQV
ncbi:uncharacterized protein LOC109508951 isoform X1 [Hippocampus comes]|uniref:uncharacterized protein LOC109508951 isoform X1 n=1 Tax=Hippocampus comes TaxID=109280 RepID=UPI00094EFCD0|nr:PREDICTED: uncharacterized protein LOC109508951 isoform X1 [Hippocampus comes]